MRRWRTRRQYRAGHLTGQWWTQRVYRPRWRTLFTFLRRFSGNRLRFRCRFDPDGVLRMGRFGLLENGGFGGVMYALLFRMLRERFLVAVRFARAGAAFAGQTPAHFERDIVVERAGVRLLVGNTQFRQQLEDDVGLDL